MEGTDNENAEDESKGFAKEEVEMAQQSGAKEITLGKRILRTETAGMMLMSVLMYFMEE